ncbi:hypothetical protein BDF19DRAFT_432742 [Syncephalis fuscata]|nr:hypothetical protein BDF19DRAFT_432742 [Syncephalis fuscata]
MLIATAYCCCIQFLSINIKIVLSSLINGCGRGMKRVSRENKARNSRLIRPSATVSVSTGKTQAL